MMWNPAATGQEQAESKAEVKARERREWEDQIATFFSKATTEMELMVMKYLRLKYPSQSTQMADLERAIMVERRKS